LRVEAASPHILRYAELTLTGGFHVYQVIKKSGNTLSLLLLSPGAECKRSGFDQGIKYAVPEIGEKLWMVPLQHDSFTKILGAG
jgi:hypothetical protein